MASEVLPPSGVFFVCFEVCNGNVFVQTVFSYIFPVKDIFLITLNPRLSPQSRLSPILKISPRIALNCEISPPFE